MQPYLFPYIGYFQLIHAVDKFVVHDDVQYIKSGFINRNKILLNHSEHLFTFSVEKAPSSYDINRRYFSSQYYIERDKFMRKIEMAYKKSKHFEEIYPLLWNCLDVDIQENNIADINTEILKKLCNYMGMKTEFLKASQLGVEKLKGKERVVAITLKLNGTHYINPIGGTKLYSKDYFSEHGIQLSFIQTEPIEYNQNQQEFIPNLSIIDVLMHNSKEEIKDMLNRYELI